MGREDLPGRVPPFNDDAERAVIGALLLADERIPEIAEQLQADDFHSKRHRILFESLCELSNRNVPVNFVTLGEALRANGHFETVGGNEYLLELAQGVTSAAHVAHHARIVAETAVLRKLIAEATAIVEEAYATRPDGESVRHLLDESEHKIFSIARGATAEGVDPIRVALEETFQSLDARQHRGLTGLSTGFYDVDQLLCGLNKGDLIIVAARPSMGKTAFALNLIENTALQQPEWLGRAPTVLLFSLEMGKQQIAQRMLCSRARVDAHKLRTGRIPTEDYAELSQAAGELGGARIFIDDSPGLSAMTVRGRARRLQAQHGLDLIVIDYLQLMSHPKAESRQMEISSISRSLKALARELEVPIVALSQLSRAVEGKDRKPRGWPLLSDLRESGSIEQDADVVMMLYRQWYYETNKSHEDAEPADSGDGERGRRRSRGDARAAAETERLPEVKETDATVIVAKHRNGPTGEVRLNFFANITRFDNLAPHIATAEPIFS